MNSAQMTLDFGTDADRAVHGTVRPLVVPAGFRLLLPSEMKQEGDMFWSRYMHDYLPELSPWTEIIILTDGNCGPVGDETVIRRHNAPRQPRRGSGVGLDAVVGGSGTEGTR